MPQDINSVTDKKGLREKLQKMFPLLPTVDERVKFLGWAGKMPGTAKSCEDDSGYLMLVAGLVIFRIALLFGISLFAYFMYLAWHGLNPDLYLAALFPSPNDPMRDYGMVGLYAYYYMLIMKSSVLFVGGSLWFTECHYKNQV